MEFELVIIKKEEPDTAIIQNFIFEDESSSGLLNRLKREKKSDTDSVGDIFDAESSLNHQEQKENISIKEEAALRTYECKKCQTLLNAQINILRNHLELHKKFPSFPYCGIKGCKKRFVCENSILSHRIVEHAKRSARILLCDFCPQTFRSKQHLKDHMLFHIVQAQKVFFRHCDKCDKTLLSQKSYKKHSQQHRDYPGFPFCGVDDCMRTFSMGRYMMQHRLTAHRSKSYNCDLCPHVSKHKASFQHHFYKIHVSREFWPHACLTCGRKFLVYSEMRKHTAIHDEPTFKCPNCDKSFKTRRYLKDHYNTMHRVERPFACSVGECPKTFNTKRLLLLHQIRAHTDARNILCGTCGKAFKLKSDLRTHEKRHLKGNKMS